MAVAEQRQARRSKLFLAARLHTCSGVRNVTVRNLSLGGALIEVAEAPPVGTAVALTRGDLRLAGTIVWVKKGQCGMHFDTPAELDLWVPSAGRAQSRVDAAVAGFKAGECPDDNEDPAEHIRRNELAPELHARISEELGFVARLMEALGDDLADDPTVAARHASKLQTIDIAVQILGHLGRVLDADDPQAAIAEIGMADLRRRLQKKPL